MIGDVNGACFVHEERSVAAGGSDFRVHVYDTKSGASQHVLTGHTGGIFDVCTLGRSSSEVMSTFAPLLRDDSL